jgi:hypothetical protein
VLIVNFLKLSKQAQRKSPQNHPEVKDIRGMEFLTEINTDFQNFDATGGKKPGSYLIGRGISPILNLPYLLLDLRKI